MAVAFTNPWIFGSPVTIYACMYAESCPKERFYKPLKRTLHDKTGFEVNNGQQFNTKTQVCDRHARVCEQSISKELPYFSGSVVFSVSMEESFCVDLYRSALKPLLKPVLNIGRYLCFDHYILPAAS